MAIFEVGSLICAVAQGPTTLIVGRAIAGLGGAGIGAGAFTIIGFIAEPLTVLPLSLVHCLDALLRIGSAGDGVSTSIYPSVA